MARRLTDDATRNAEAARRMRERKRNGVIRVKDLDLTPEEIDVLCDARVLGAWDEKSPAHIKAAIKKLLRIIGDVLAKDDLVSVEQILMVAGSNLSSLTTAIMEVHIRLLWIPMPARCIGPRDLIWASSGTEFCGPT